MRKIITQIGLLSLVTLLSSFKLIAAPPVTFSSKGSYRVSPLGKMYVKGGMHMFPGAAVTQDGLTVLTGHFIHDASDNVFKTVYPTNPDDLGGIIEFRGASTDEQLVTTNLAAYTPKAGGSTTGKMDRKTMYLTFPNIKVNNGSRVVITPSMGVSVNKLIFTNGKLRLKSDDNGGNDQDASLLVKSAEGYTNTSHMEIERNVIYNRGKVAGTTGFKYFGFSAPMANMYLDYFTDHWVFDQRMNSGAGGYDIRRYQRFDPGVGYFVVVREESNTTVTNPTDYIRDGLLIQNEHFLFNRTYKDDFFSWHWNAQIPTADKTQPQEILSTGNVTIPGGLKVGDNYLGNPYTCALDIDALFTSWGANIKPTMWLWSGQASNWLVITKDMTTIDMDSKQKVVPSQQMFVVEGVSAVPTFNIPVSARTHNAHRYLRSAESLKNELLVEVQDAELDNYSRMAIGLRSWGKLTGDDESDAKYIKNEDVNIPQIYAVVPHKNTSMPYDTLTINSLPEDVRSTNFDFVPAQIDGNRKYIMKISRQESLTTGMAVLIDRKEKVEIDILENDTYEFYADRFDDTQRFTIRFAPADATHKEDPVEVRTRDAYFQGKTLYVTQNRESDIRKPVEVYNASGVLVYKDQIDHTGTNTYELNLTEGVYIVKSGEMVKKFKK